MPETYSFTKEHSQKIDDIHEALVGNPLDPKAPPGLIATVLKHHDDLYGDKDSEAQGIKQKVERIDATQSEWKWKASGVLLGLGIIVEGIKLWLFHK